MSLETTRVRRFLLTNPKPNVVRVSGGPGGTEEMRVSRQSFVRLAESIVAIEPELIECLDKDGSLIRALKTVDLESRSDAVTVPDGLKADPQALMLTHFASLLHRAYEHSTEIAFSKLVEIVDRIDSRSDAIETRLERSESQHRRALMDQVDMEFDRAEEHQRLANESSPEKDMIGSLVQGLVMGNKKQATAPNGKAD